MRYEDADLAGEGFNVLYCTDCGAVVYDETAHDGWHHDMANQAASIYTLSQRVGQTPAKPFRSTW